MLSVNKNSLISSFQFLNIFIYVYYLIQPTTTSSTMLNSSDQRWNPFLFLILTCIADLTHSASYLTVHTLSTVPWIHGRDWSHKNCRHIYSLLADIAADLTQRSLSPGWCSSHGSVLSWLTQSPSIRLNIFSALMADKNGHSWDTAVMPLLSKWSSWICTVHSSLWPSEYLLICRQNATSDLSCYINLVISMHSAINDLSSYIVIIYKMWDEWAWTHHFGQTAHSPHCTPSGSLTSHSMHSPSSVIFSC